MPDVQGFLDQVTAAVGPHLRDVLGDQFGLTGEQATRAVPAAMQPLIEGLQAKAENPQAHVETLMALYRTLTDEDQATEARHAAPAAPTDDLVGLVERVAGQKLGAFVQHVAGELGLEEGTARLVTLVVLPKAMAYLRGLTQREDIGAVIEPLVDEGTAQQLDGLLGLLKSKDKLGNMLGGLFG